MGRFWLTVMGAGYSPVAPGTCGSLVVAALFAVLALAGVPPLPLAGIMLAVALHGCLVTVLYGDKAMAEESARTGAEIKDPSFIVSDEQAGQAIALASLAWLPYAATSLLHLLLFAAAAFLLFRAFDILKPPPVCQLERVPGAWGVLLDDLAAGAYAAIILTLLYQCPCIRDLGGRF